MQYVLDAVNKKTRLSHCLLPGMGRIQKMFPAILDMKNANKVQKIFKLCH